MTQLFWPSSDRGSADRTKLHFIVVVHDSHPWGWGVTTLCGRAGYALREAMFEERPNGFTRDAEIFCASWDTSACGECKEVAASLVTYGRMLR